MTLDALRDDALARVPDGFELRLSLPWIRSLPLASLDSLEVVVDGDRVDPLAVELDGRLVDPAALAHEGGWWFLQDRLVLRGGRMLRPGPHDVVVSFRLLIPYLQAGPDGPLTLPFHVSRTLTSDAAGATPHPADAAQPTPRTPDATHETWTLAASAFNWTPEVIRAERPAPEIAVGIVTGGIAPVIELEPGQLWRSFPTAADVEIDALRRELDAAGGSVSIVGASLDDWLGPTQRRSGSERLAFLLPQLHAARRVGAAGVRLPIGQAGEGLLRQVLPTLQELDLVLFEEIQGQQTPDSPETAAAIDVIAGLDDAHVRLLVDISMLMPALPTTYLEQLAAAGIPADLLTRLTEEWRDPATMGAVVAHLRSGAVPPAIHALYMNLLVRFGRSDASELRGILPLVGAFHLKFWDLDDADGRVSAPIRDLGALLGGTDFVGTLCSEWGGHEWLVEADAADMTRRHLNLARRALAEGAAV